MPVPSGTIEHMLRVKRLEAGARVPVVAHPGEDLGYDLFALEDTVLESARYGRVRTGIAVEARDRKPGRAGTAGARPVVDGGARDCDDRRGDRRGIPGRDSGADDQSGRDSGGVEGGREDCQMIPVPVLTGVVEEVETWKTRRGRRRDLGVRGDRRASQS